MFCSNCGNQCSEGAVFCSKCGKTISGVGYVNRPVEKKKRTGLILGIVGAVGVVATMCLFFVITALMPKKINLNDYLVTDFEGYDTVGFANIYFDTEAFYLDYGDKIEFKKTREAQNYKNLYGLFGTEPIDGFEKLIYVNASQYYDVKNGDIIEVEWNCNEEDIEKYFNYGVKYKDIEVEVEGLKELKEIDLFEPLEISFYGYSPKIQLRYQVTSTDALYVDLIYEPIKNELLTEGDEVKFVVYERYGMDLDKYLASYGYKAKADNKTYTVTGEGEYITDINQIPQETLDAMIQQGEEVALSYLTREILKHESTSAELDVSYVGNYFLTAKNGQTEETQNRVYLIYKIDYCITYYDNFWGSGSNKNKYYFAVAYDNITADRNGGALVELEEYSFPSGRVTINVIYIKETGKSEQYTTLGYVSINNIYQQLVEKVIDKYVYTENLLTEE